MKQTEDTKTHQNVDCFLANSPGDKNHIFSPVLPQTLAKQSKKTDENKENYKADTSPIKLTSANPTTNTTAGVIKLTSDAQSPTTAAILNLKTNPFYQDKRKWDESFTIAEKKELTGNIVKAAKDNDGETYVTLQEEEFCHANLHGEYEEDSQESDDLLDSVNDKKLGRKPLADEEDISDSDQDPKVKRKAQNRAAQRAFRERKERYVKELEARIKQVQETHLAATTQLVRENHQLRSIIYTLETENYALKGIPLQPYQHQTTIQPPSPPSIQRNSSSNSSNGGGNYPAIAPLLPNTHQQPLLLPAYLSNTSNSSSIPSVLAPHSPSVQQMMLLASSPLQQYPMSPLVSNSIVSSNNSTVTSPKANHANKPAPPLPIAKKAPSTTRRASPNNSTPPPNNQPLEYTFSISTPASLRPSGGSTSSASSKHTRSEPVELVQLYPPSGNRSGHQPQSQRPKSPAVSPSAITDSPSSTHSSAISFPQKDNDSATIDNKEAPISSTDNSSGLTGPNMSVPTTTDHHNNNNNVIIIPADDTESVISELSSSTHTPHQQSYKKMHQLELDLFDCHIDIEGQLFCERLRNEVYFVDVFVDGLLSEPLFDQMGKLNLSMSNDYSVSALTGTDGAALGYIDVGENSGNSSSSSISSSNNIVLSSTPQHGQNNATVRDDVLVSRDILSHNTDLLSSTASDNSLKNTTATDAHSRLLTCTEIWFLLSQHEKFDRFTTDQLFQAVKRLAKRAENGPVLEESDLQEIMSKMDRGCF